MTRETLFELLDSELEADQLKAAVEQLLNDPEMQKSWHRQHLVRAAIHDQELLGRGDMVDRVANALADEPTVMAPDNLASLQVQQGASTGNTVVPMPSIRPRRRYLAYVAVAASLLAVVLFNLPQPAPESPAIASQQTNAPVTQAAEQELQAMIVQHGEFSGAASLNGLVAYAKVVAGSTPGSRASQP